MSTRLAKIMLALVEVAGAAAIVDGVARVYLPAAFIVAGVLAILGANLADRLIPTAGGDA